MRSRPSATSRFRASDLQGKPPSRKRPRMQRFDRNVDATPKRGCALALKLCLQSSPFPEATRTKNAASFHPGLTSRSPETHSTSSATGSMRTEGSHHTTLSRCSIHRKKWAYTICQTRETLMASNNPEEHTGSWRCLKKKDRGRVASMSPALDSQTVYANEYLHAGLCW